MHLPSRRRSQSADNPLRRSARGVGFAAALVAAAALAGCAEAPVTGRQQLILVDEAQANQLGAEAWQQIKAEKPAAETSALQDRVDSIGKKLIAASGERGLDWEFQVFDDPTPNAFALPGGKIGVHSGMAQIAETDAQLAAVLAHEVGHVVARHPSEQMSQSAAIQTALGVAGAGEGAVGQLVQLATGVGALSFSRSAEAEADRIGLEYMARAGYDPRAAVELWQNMEQATAADGRPPEFLSTHPDPQSRIAAIRGSLPEVMPIYRAQN
jgi:predicted Zn-dependent protease